MIDKVNYRDAALNFDLMFDDAVEDIFVDGVAQTMIGSPISKLSFYVSDGVDKEGVEQRRVKIRLAMSTLGLIAMAQIVLGQIVSNKDAISSNEKAISAQVEKLLSELSVVTK